VIGAVEGDVRPLTEPRSVDDLGDERMIGFGSDEVVPTPDGEHIGVPLRPGGGQIPCGDLRPEAHRPTRDPAFWRELRQSGAQVGARAKDVVQRLLLHQ